VVGTLAEALVGTFNTQDVAITGVGMMRGWEGWAEALAGMFNTHQVANTLWAHATMGREPGTSLMRGLDGWATAVAGTFNTQEVSSTLYQEGSRWVHTVVRLLVSLDKPGCLNTAQLCQLHLCTL
jgi:hypothetical protein